MPIFHQNLILAFLIVFSQNIELLGITSADEKRDFYEEGLSHKNSGDWPRALDIWLTGKRILQQQGKSDPRIGIAFIELTTERKAIELYELASEIYFWGFSKNNLNKYKKEIEQEIKRIAPLLDKNQYEAWRLLWRQGDPLLYEKIKAFWLEKDSTPSTKLNERLLEHWERIAYARKNFKKANNTVYGTDDRGLIFVKYGFPEKKLTGTLGLNRAQLKIWTDIFASNFEENLIVQAIDRYNTHPEYELWFYYFLNSKEPIFYLFGNREGIGSYGLRNGIEDFIPDRAFYRTSTRYTGGILPGAVLQTMYYSELMHLNSYFASRLNELESNWTKLERDGVSALRHVNNNFRNIRKYFQLLEIDNPLRAYAPLDKSNFEESISPVKLVYQTVRLLDHTNKPELAIIVLSYPQFNKKYFSLNDQKTIPDHSVIHTLIVRDEIGKEIQRFIDTLPLSYDNISTFIFQHNKKQNDYLLFVELFNVEGYSPEKTLSDYPAYKYQIIGIGRTTIGKTSPLITASEKLELSDLIIGIKIPGDSVTERLPFPVIPTNKIWQPDSLKIYLEIYHLHLDSNGMAHFTIDFQITKLDRKKKRRKEIISLSFNFGSPQRTSKENFEIDISNLKPGNYELLVEVTDTVSLQKKLRKAGFEIVKESQK